MQKKTLLFLLLKVLEGDFNLTNPPTLCIYTLRGGAVVENISSETYKVNLYPNIALRLGINEAIVIDAIHQSLCSEPKLINGDYWVRKTYKEWVEILPFFSYDTFKRTVRGLEDTGYIISKSFDGNRMCKTKCYQLNYEKIKDIK